jgi:DNA (cytosine-5)-methyltransferase 1
MTLTLIDFFCGAGGSSQGAAAVPGVTVRLAANHWDRAIESHAANFPAAEHFQGDIHDADVARMPPASIFWASPECPNFSQARGRRREWDRQPDLFGETLPDPAADRSRALMHDVPRYLEAKAAQGRPVLAGVVENVTEVRQWNQWPLWLAAIRNLGYDTRLIALNSMHAAPRVTDRAPQSRDRLYLAYWRTAIGRAPDWDKWLRPAAWCPACDTRVRAVQWWKRPGADMGRYRQSYLYRCPNARCRAAVIEPPALPAAAAIDWTDPGTRIGDRKHPMRDATKARITAGLARYARPITLEAAGHTFERRPGTRTRPADTAPLTTLHATTSKGLACPPLLVPAGGTWRGHGPDGARPVSEPMPTRTVRENDGIAIPDAHAARLLVPYYGSATAARPAAEPAGTMTARDRYGLAVADLPADVDDVLFRMLKPPEVGRAMAFGATYTVLGTQREKVRQYGNAVTPPVAEVLISALAEAVTGTDLETAA